MAKGGYSDLRLYRRLVELGRPYTLHIIGVLALSLMSAPLAVLQPLPLKIAVDSAIGSHPLPSLVNRVLPASLERSDAAALAIAIALLMATTVLIYVQSLGGWWLNTYTGEKLVLEFRTRLFRHVQRLSLSYHDTMGATDSVYRIQYDAQSIQHIAIDGGIPLLTAGLTVVGMVLITLMIDWQLALIALAVCPLLYWLIERFRPLIRERWRDVKQLDSSAMSVVQEALGAMRVVKAFGREDDAEERFEQTSNERVRGQIDLAWMQGRFDLYTGLIIAAGTGLVLLVGVMHVKSDRITLGELLMVMAYLAQFYQPLKTISKKLTDLQSGVASAERAFAILDETPEVVERPHAKPIRRAKGEVEFRDVSFSYEAGRPVLRRVAFRVEPGTRVGIQGRTGAGKTTLASLLMRFYDPDSGQVLLDGIDLRDYRLADLRNQFAIVLQEPVLFSTTIAENVAYGRPGASRSEIIEAAKLANAHDFIVRLPESYDTQVGERGMRLSGGERQRISLARAFLKDSPMLILDEPTSSVDIKTEASIMDAMNRLMRGRTTFLIAHRLTTLEGCDVRWEIEEGRPRMLSAQSPPMAVPAARADAAER